MDLSSCYTSRQERPLRYSALHIWSGDLPTTNKQGSVLPATVDGHRLLTDLDYLARLGASADGDLKRVGYSPEDLEARRWLEAEMRGLSLEVRTDRAGNSIGSYPGQDSRLPPIAIGSHTDTVPEGGRYDGTLGVVAGLGCVRAPQESEVRLQHPGEVINF